MSNLVEQHLQGFQEELQKLAAPNWKNIAGGASALMGVGGAIGGVLGAGSGAISSYREAKRQGASTGEAVGAGVHGTLGGAAKGAILGAGVGALGGAAMGHLKPSVATALTQKNIPVVSGAARFGQRQLHGLSGWTPEGGIRSIRGGAYDAEQGLNSAKKALQGASTETRGKAEGSVMKAQKSYDAASKAEGMGLTSLPGYAKSLKNNGVGSTLKADVANQWHGASNTSKAMMLGLPAIGLASSAASKDVVDASGQGKAERIGKSIGNMAGGVLGSPLPIVGQTIVGSGLGAVGRLAGKGVDRLRGVGPQKLPENTYGGQT